MRKLFYFSIALAGMIILTLTSTTASAGGFISKTKQCPVTGATLLPAGSRYNIDDIIISTTGATDVELHFNPPKTTMLRVYLDANETVVANFNGSVEGEKEQGLNLTCSGNATVSITLVGSESF
jgi:hypothetical protein